MPVQRSRRPALWATAHAALALPFELWSRGRLYVGNADGEDVPIACIGLEKRFAPILARLFERLEPAGALPRQRLWDPDHFAGLSMSLLLVETHRWAAPRFADAGWLIVPDSVRWQGDMSSVPPPAPTNSLRSDLRKVRKRGYTLEVADGPEDWREFYEEMVLPSARQRFGGDAWLPSGTLRRDINATGTLLFVCHSRQRIAAACVVDKRPGLWVPLIGVRGGDVELIRDGASTAACAFTVEWARENGFQFVDWGRTSPFIHDGVQHFNRKWGFSPVPDPITHVTAIRIDPRCVALRRAFEREPVLIQTAGGLRTYGA